jgi:hypothetical protein
MPSLVVLDVTVYAAGFVRKKRITRVHVFTSGLSGTIVPTKRTEVGPRASHGFLEDTLRSWIRILRSHHRAFDSGAVLGVVNALRCASTRPVAGPSGIDDVSARHTFRQLRDGGQRVDGSNEVDAGIAPAYVGVIVSVPYGTPSVCPKGHGARIRSAPTGHGIERTPTHRRLMPDDREAVRRRVY